MKLALHTGRKRRTYIGPVGSTPEWVVDPHGVVWYRPRPIAPMWESRIIRAGEALPVPVPRIRGARYFDRFAYKLALAADPLDALRDRSETDAIVASVSVAYPGFFLEQDGLARWVGLRLRELMMGVFVREIDWSERLGTEIARETGQDVDTITSYLKELLHGADAPP